MNDSTVETANLAAARVDMNLWSLFWKADIVVQSVIVVLILASIWSWAIIFDKWIRYARVKRKADDFEDRFWSGGSLEALYDEIAAKARHPMEVVFVSAMEEWRRSTANRFSLKLFPNQHKN